MSLIIETSDVGTQNCATIYEQFTFDDFKEQNFPRNSLHSKEERREAHNTSWNLWKLEPKTVREVAIASFQWTAWEGPTVGQARRRLAEALRPPPRGLTQKLFIYHGSFMGRPDMDDDNTLFPTVDDLYAVDDGLGEDGTRELELQWTAMYSNHDGPVSFRHGDVRRC
jgi:hypothetical protein